MKRIIALLLMLAIAVTLMACEQDAPQNGGETISTQHGGLVTKDPTEPQTTEPNQTEPSETEPIQTQPPFVLESWLNTYWVADEWEYEGDVEAIPDTEMIDLTIFPDGSARLRDVLGEYILYNEEDLWLELEETANGVALLYADRGDTFGFGVLEGSTLNLDYLGGTLHLEYQPMPQPEDNLYCPAELQGTWQLLRSGSYDDMWEVMPGYSETLYIDWDTTDAGDGLYVTKECRSNTGELVEAYMPTLLKIQDEPLNGNLIYTGWRVKLTGGDDGMEEYFTLLDQDTLFAQTRYPGEDGQTDTYYYSVYHKTLKMRQQWSFDYTNLEGAEWECVGYVDAEGNAYDYPEGMENFYIYMDIYPMMYMSWDVPGEDERYSLYGEWVLNDFGNIVLWDDDNENDWFAGAVFAGHTPSEYEMTPTLEMYLYWHGGIIHLRHIDGSGGEGG